jgi:hypothetical protein
MQIGNQTYLIVINMNRLGIMINTPYQPKPNLLRIDLNILS